MVAAVCLELVVVRHGVTAWNLERRYQGQRDIPLLFASARPGLERLRGALEPERFDAVHCSDLLRCRETLAFVRPDLLTRVSYDARLRELDFGAYEGRTWETLQEDPGYRAWVDSAGELAPPGGESSAQLWARLSAWLGEVFARAQTEGHQRVLAVSHGGAIRELRRRLEAIDFWSGTVTQAEGRRFSLCQRHGEWTCSATSGVPAPAAGA
jgi:alpha-ribazole phosphatase